MIPHNIEFLKTQLLELLVSICLREMEHQTPDVEPKIR